MAITNSNIYQDLIMNPDFMPNRLQNLQMFPPVDVPSRIDFTSGDELVPGMGEPAINYTDAPVSLMMRQNNPTKGFLDKNFNYRALNLGTPEATAKYLAKNNFSIPENLQGIDTRSFLDKTKDTFSKGKSGLEAIAQFLPFGEKSITGSLLRGITSALPERDYRQKALEDFYGNIKDGTIQGGLMAGYNPVSGGLFGGDVNYGLGGAIDKRIARIQKTLKKKKSKVLEQRVKDLQALKAREAKALEDARAKQAQALESQRRGRRPTAPTGGGTRDDQGDRSSGQTGGYSYDSGGRQGFGYGL